MKIAFTREEEQFIVRLWVVTTLGIDDEDGVEISRAETPDGGSVWSIESEDADHPSPQPPKPKFKVVKLND